MNNVPLPVDLTEVDWFVVVWDRDGGRFILVLRDNTSHSIQDGSFPLAYLTRALGNDDELAGRVLDIARNFIVSVCYPELGEALPAPEQFIKSKSETEIMFDEKNREPWPAIMAPRGTYQ